MIWLSRFSAYIQPHLIARTKDTLKQLANITDAIMKARTPSFQIAHPLTFRVLETDSAIAFEVKLNLQITQLRLSLQQEMTEQHTLRKSIEAIGESNRRGRYFQRQIRLRSQNRGQQINCIIIGSLDQCNSLRTAMLVPTTSGKRRGSSMMAAGDGRATGRLFVTDHDTRISFLIDTGADLCVYPRKMLNGKPQRSTYELSAANGTIIYTYGTQTLTLNLGLQRVFVWRFVVADVSKPIIGADFFAFYELLVDI